MWARRPALFVDVCDLGLASIVASLWSRSSGPVAVTVAVSRSRYLGFMSDDERARLQREARVSRFDPDSFGGKEGLLELDRLCRGFAADGTPSSLSNLRFALLSKAGGTYEKHEVPRIASAAL